jgi:hypothetical protein
MDEALCRWLCDVLGSSRREDAAPVSVRDGFVCPPTVRSEALVGASPRSLGPPPQSTFASEPAPCLSARRWPTWGFGPLRDLTAPRPLTTSTSQALATFRPRAFSAPRRFAPRCGSWVCSTPLPRPGLSSVQGLLPPCSLSPLIGKSCPLAVQRVRDHRPKPAATRACLDFEALLHTRSRCLRLGVTRLAARSPPRVLVPSGR